MNRREAVKSIALASAATIFLTSCGDKKVPDQLFVGKLRLNDKHKDYLAKISETFLPVSDIKELSEPPIDFILKMINDCKSPEEIIQFAEGFEAYKNLMAKSKLRIRSSEPESIVEAVKAAMEELEPTDDLLYFIETTRSLSILNLQASEFYMTEYWKYEMIPSEFNPCIDLKTIINE